LIAIVMAVLALTLMANRKPRFEVPTERKTGSALNWFTLKKDSTVEVKIKQLYFGVGIDFEEAGWMIPPHKSEHMLCLIVAESEVEVETQNKGLQTWFLTLVTQSVAGDLYREALKAQQSKAMKWCPSKDLLAAPNLDVDLADSFDVLTVNGGHDVSIRISHEQHPTNPSKSFYKLDWN